MAEQPGQRGAVQGAVLAADGLPDLSGPPKDLAHRYRRRIEFQNLATPLELAALAEGRAGADDNDVGWAREQMALMRPRGPMRLWRREALHEHVFRYRGAAQASPRPGVLVAFCGHGLRLMLPIAVLLQRIDARQVDVLMLRDPGRDFYADGIAGYAGDLVSVCRRLADEAGLFSYRDLYCLGTSGGGAAGLLAARLLGARRGASVGAGLGADARQRMDYAWAAPALRPGAAPPRLLNIYSAQNVRDVEGNARIVEAFPGCLSRAVPDTADHNTLHELLKRGQLGTFLRVDVLGQSPQAWRAAAAPSIQ